MCFWPAAMKAGQFHFWVEFATKTVDESKMFNRVSKVLQTVLQ